MKQLIPILNKIHEKLNLPQPEKSRVFMEIKNDMEDLYEFYLAKGFPDNEAANKTEEKFNADDNTIQQLLLIHESKYNKWLNNISAQTQKKWERSILIFLLLFIFVFIGRQFTAHDFFLNSSVFILPIAPIFIAAVGISIWKVYQLFIVKDHHLKKIRKGLPTLIYFAGASITISVLGFLHEMYNMVLKTADDLERALLYFTDWLIKCSSLLMFGMVVSIVIAIIWFFLLNKIQTIEYSEAEIEIRELN